MYIIKIKLNYDLANELKHPIPLLHGDLEFTPDNLDDCIEIVEEFEGYSQIVCVLYEDFGVSLFL